MIMVLEKDQRKSLAIFEVLMKKRGYENEFHAIRYSIKDYLTQCGYAEEEVKKITGPSFSAVRGFN